MEKAAKTMRAIFLDGPMKLSIREVPIPKPADGEVLIKVMAAPVNPSDLVFLYAGSYDQKKTPCIPGFEGSGLVVENGGGFMGWGIVGKRVAFTPTMASGSYSQYALARSGECLPVDQEISYEHASMSFVNPLTAIALLSHAKNKKAKTVIINAAASSLGRMMNRLIPQEQIEIINIVRKEEHFQVLRKEGANHILNSSEPDFDEKLKEMANRMKATVCFDAVGGEMTGRMVKCMPKNSFVYVYGALDGAQVKSIDVISLIHMNATITGFYLPHWLENRGMVKMLSTVYKLGGLLKNELKSEIAMKCSLEEFEESVKTYASNMTKGKLILRPHADKGDNEEENEGEKQVKDEKEEEKEVKENEGPKEKGEMVEEEGSLSESNKKITTE